MNRTIKHLNDLETGHTERTYKEHLYLAKEQGLKTEQESIIGEILSDNYFTVIYNNLR